ncbi:MAG: hypothetical protein AB1744_06590, partial [Candidatus Zixiibacteriota bacterium]
KLRRGEYDAIIIAAAGIKRLKLDLSDLEVVYLDPEHFLPAPGQGLLAVEIRKEDVEAAELVKGLGTQQEEHEAALERGLLARFESGCSLPLGVYSWAGDGLFRLRAVLGIRSGDGWGSLKWGESSGGEAETVVEEVVSQLR